MRQNVAPQNFFPRELKYAASASGGEICIRMLERCN
jgi:hypothetical protein